MGGTSCGRVVFPNLGYKKDAFLEPSLVSNNSSSHSNNQQQSGLSPRAPDFAPSGSLSGPGVIGTPAPVDSLGRSGVALMQGGQMCAMFILLV